MSHHPEMNRFPVGNSTSTTTPSMSTGRTAGDVMESSYGGAAEGDGGDIYMGGGGDMSILPSDLARMSLENSNLLDGEVDSPWLIVGGLAGDSSGRSTPEEEAQALRGGAAEGDGGDIYMGDGGDMSMLPSDLARMSLENYNLQGGVVESPWLGGLAPWNNSGRSTPEEEAQAAREEELLLGLLIARRQRGRAADGTMCNQQTLSEESNTFGYSFETQFVEFPLRLGTTDGGQLFPDSIWGS